MSSEIRKRFRIREFRESIDETQEQLAIAIGVSHSTVKSWERCASAPKADAVIAMCEHFHTDPNTLLGWYDEHPEDRPSASVTREESALLDNYRACSPDRRASVSGYARDECALSQAQEASGSSEARLVVNGAIEHSDGSVTVNRLPDDCVAVIELPKGFPAGRRRPGGVR